MKKIELCEECPVSNEVHERVNGFISLEENDYIRSGQFLLNDYLIPFTGAHKVSTDRVKTYDRAARNVSLSIVYLAQVESCVTHANSIACEATGSIVECARVNELLASLRRVRSTMIADVTRPD